MTQNSSPNDKLVLSTIIENIPAMVFYKDLNGCYIAANRMFCNQLKTTPEEIQGKSDFDFYDIETATHYRDSDLEVLHSGKPIDGFEEETKINGEIRVFATKKVLLKDSENKPYGIIGLAYDVTENRKAEEELIESHTRYKYLQELFRLMADNMPDMLWAKDLRKRYLFANKAMCENLLMARDTNEPIGKTDFFFAERERSSHPDDPEWHTFGQICSDTDDLTIKQRGAGKYLESGNIRGQLVHLDVQKAPILDEQGNMIGTVGSARDITSQKLIEQEFHALNQRNRAIISVLPDLMFLVDQNGVLLDCYMSTTHENSASLEGMIGQPLEAYFSEPIATQIHQMIRECLATDKTQGIEFQREQGGKSCHFEARVIRVDNSNVLCITRDITERKALQQGLIEAKERAEESSRLKSTLMNNMSHELRTPLNGILGFSEILLNEIAEVEHKEMVQHISNSGKRLMKTLESIMQLSQLESGLNYYKPELIDPVLFIRSLAESRMAAVKAKKLYLEVRDKAIRPGVLDRFFFTQAISNILDNAIKFTTSGGVTITLDETCTEEKRYLVICIADTGIGMSADHLKIIFEEFRQVSEGQNRSFEGTGLGLTIAKKMIALLGGEVKVTSTMNKGSLFEVQLPFNENLTHINPAKQPKNLTAQKPATPPKDFPPSPPRPAILLVEDNDVNVQLSMAYLKNQYEIDWALDGATAIKMAGQKRYQAILMDINLGLGMDGLEATRIIRSMNGYESTPIIALTGYTLFGDRDRLIAGGCTEYLGKPFSKRDILDLLDSVLNNK